MQISLKDFTDEELINAIDYANYSISCGNFASHNRPNDEKKNEGLRGILGQILSFTYFRKLSLNWVENFENPETPELKNIKTGLTYDIKLITRTVHPRSNFNCPNCKNNVDKDHKIYPDVIYIFGTFYIPISSKLYLNLWTRRVFDYDDLNLLKNCIIFLSGQISHRKFWDKKIHINEGEDLNEGAGSLVLPSYYDCYKCCIRDLEPLNFL